MADDKTDSVLVNAYKAITVTKHIETKQNKKNSQA